MAGNLTADYFWRIWKVIDCCKTCENFVRVATTIGKLQHLESPFLETCEWAIRPVFPDTVTYDHYCWWLMDLHLFQHGAMSLQELLLLLLLITLSLLLISTECQAVGLIVQVIDISNIHQLNLQNLLCVFIYIATVIGMPWGNVFILLLGI